MAQSEEEHAELHHTRQSLFRLKIRELSVNMRSEEVQLDQNLLHLFAVSVHLRTCP